MAGFNERVKVIIDVVNDGASKGLADFRSDLKNSEGAVGKLKTTWGGATAYVKANAAQMAIGAGTAIAGLAATSVAKFQEIALAAGTVSDATDMSTEASSRWLDVVGRYGVEMGDLLDVFNNVAGKVAEGDDVFDDLGVTIARTETGAVDMNETMIRVVETVGQIEDPAKRARIAAELFGEEGSRQFAELIAGGEDFRDLLDEVADGKVIDDDQVDRARRFRDAMNDLKVAGEEAMIVIGDGLVPAVTGFAEALGEVRTAFDNLPSIPDWAKDAYNAWNDYLGPQALMKAPMEVVSGLGNLFGGGDGKDSAPAKWVRDVVDEWKTGMETMVDEAIEGVEAYEAIESGAQDYTKAQDLVNDYITEGTEAWREQQDAIRDARNEARQLTDATYGLWDAEEALVRSIEEQANEVLQDEETDLYAVRSALVEVALSADEMAQRQVELEGRTMDTDAGMRIWLDSMLASAATLDGPMRTAVLDHIARVAGVPEEEITEFRAAVDDGTVASAENTLSWLARPRTSTLSVHQVGLTKTNLPSWYAKGTEFAPGGMAVVGEEGPELVKLPHGEKVKTARATAAMASTASSMPPSIVQVTQNFPRGTRPDDVVAAQRRWAPNGED